MTNIMATDMTKHNKTLSKLAKRIKATHEYNDLAKSGAVISETVKDMAILKERFEDRRVSELLMSGSELCFTSLSQML